MMRVRRSMVAANALFVAFVFGARTVGADCPQERDAPQVVVFSTGSGQFNRGQAARLASHFVTELGNDELRVRLFDIRWADTLLHFHERQLQTGGTADFESLSDNIGSPFLLSLEFSQVRTVGRTLIRTLTNTRNRTIIWRFQDPLPADADAAWNAVGDSAARTATTLLCDLLRERARPVVPLLVVDVTPHDVAPGGTVHVTATLTDSSNRQPQGGKQIRIKHKHGIVLLEPRWEMTNEYGVAGVDLNVGTDPGPATVEVTFRDALARTTASNPDKFHYNVLGATGDLQASAPEPALHLGDGETVTAQLTHGGAPVVGTPVTFAATGGGAMAAATVATDANGNASTQYQAPNTNAVVDVTASAPAPPAKGPKAAGSELTASLTFVVDGGVTLNVNALDTVAGATSEITADLVVGGTAIPGTDVTFTLLGAGALSAASAPTDDAGRAEVTWVAPEGNSTADITAEAVVDGQTYTKSVTVHAGPVGGIGVKVVPKFDNGWGTYAQTVDNDPYFDLHDLFSCSTATLAGLNECQSGFDFGTTAADPPVTLQPGPLTANITNQMVVTHPGPNVVVVEFKAAGGANGTARPQIDDLACLELAFDKAGSLTIDADPSGFTAGVVFPRVFRPKGGPVFAVGGEFYQDAFSPGAGSSMTSENVDVGQRETFQILIQLSASRSDGAVPDGTYKFTLTFHPQ